MQKISPRRKTRMKLPETTESITASIYHKRFVSLQFVLCRSSAVRNSVFTLDEQAVTCTSIYIYTNVLTETN